MYACAHARVCRCFCLLLYFWHTVQLNLNSCAQLYMHYTYSKRFVLCLQVHRKLMMSQLLAESKKLVASLNKLVHLTHGVYLSIVCVCVCVCVCVRPSVRPSVCLSNQQAIKHHSHEMKPIKQVLLLFSLLLSILLMGRALVVKVS